MTVADQPSAGQDRAPADSPPPRAVPPAPEECSHPAPIEGVMAHEFAPYPGAMGPEGRRRTTMLYGPVVGGLPIDAWHCETCGLLRLRYPDGRREERRLYPGPQPGLLAVPVVDARAPEARRGAQARVSGVSLPPELARRLLAEDEARLPGFRLPTIEVPDYGMVTWLTLLLLVATGAGLVGLMYGAVADYRTTGWEGGLAAFTAAAFVAAVILQVAAAAMRHFFPFPRLAPSPATALRGAPVIDPVTGVVVGLLAVLVAGLGLAGLLAIYDWRTPGAEGPLVTGLGAVFGIATVTTVVGGGVRRLLRPPRGDASDADVSRHP